MFRFFLTASLLIGTAYGRRSSLSEIFKKKRPWQPKYFCCFDSTGFDDNFNRQIEENTNDFSSMLFCHGKYFPNPMKSMKCCSTGVCPLETNDQIVVVGIADDQIRQHRPHVGKKTRLSFPDESTASSSFHRPAVSMQKNSKKSYSKQRASTFQYLEQFHEPSYQQHHDYHHHHRHQQQRQQMRPEKRNRRIRMRRSRLLF